MVEVDSLKRRYTVSTTPSDERQYFQLQGIL